MEEVEFLSCWRLVCSLSHGKSAALDAHLVKFLDKWLWRVSLDIVGICPLRWKWGLRCVSWTLSRTRSCIRADIGGISPLSNRGKLLALYSEVNGLSIIIEFVFVVNISQLFKVDLVSQNGTDSTKTLYELISFAGSVRNEFQGGTEILVLFGKPF